MNRAKIQTMVLLAGTATLALLTPACYVSSGGSGIVERDSQTVDLKGAKSVQVQIEMGVSMESNATLPTTVIATDSPHLHR